jgi:hypothetical protein
MRRFLLTVALVFCLTAPAFAWSAAGHKFVASIAFARLTPAEREKVIEILREHPRFKQDFLDKLPDEAKVDSAKNEFHFQEAAIWPDVVRGFRGDDAKYNHGTWHYINVPSFLNESDKATLDGKLTEVNFSLVSPEKPVEKMNAIQTLKVSRKMLADKNTSPEDKAIHLAWLFHLVGDIHQPLHSTAMFSPRLFPLGDRGGNSVLTVQRRNLHSLWDGLPGNEAKLQAAHNEAAKLIADADLSKLGETAAIQLDEETWMNESRELAVNFVYSPDLLNYVRKVEQEGSDLKPFEFDEGYLRAGGKICDKRVVQAGYRLAAVLKQIVGGQLTAVEARKRVGEEVVVRITVKATKNRLEKRGEIFLDSEEDFRDEKNLGIVVTRTGAQAFQIDGIGDPAEHFKGRTIEVRGKVIVKEERPRIEIDGPKQIRIVESP